MKDDRRDKRTVEELLKESDQSLDFVRTQGLAGINESEDDLGPEEIEAQRRQEADFNEAPPERHRRQEIERDPNEAPPMRKAGEAADPDFVDPNEAPPARRKSGKFEKVEAEARARRMRRQAEDEKPEDKRRRRQAEDEKPEDERRRRQAEDEELEDKRRRRQAEDEDEKPEDKRRRRQAEVDNLGGGTADPDGKKQTPEEMEGEAKRLRRQAEDLEDTANIARRRQADDEKEPEEVARRKQDAEDKEFEARRLRRQAEDLDDTAIVARRKQDDEYAGAFAGRRQRRGSGTPGVPDGTGPGKDSPECPNNKGKQDDPEDAEVQESMDSAADKMAQSAVDKGSDQSKDKLKEKFLAGMEKMKDGNPSDKKKGKQDADDKEFEARRLRRQADEKEAQAEVEKRRCDKFSASRKQEAEDAIDDKVDDARRMRRQADELEKEARRLRRQDDEDDANFPKAGGRKQDDEAPESELDPTSDPENPFAGPNLSDIREHFVLETTGSWKVPALSVSLADKLGGNFQRLIDGLGKPMWINLIEKKDFRSTKNAYIRLVSRARKGARGAKVFDQVYIYWDPDRDVLAARWMTQDGTYKNAKRFEGIADLLVWLDRIDISGQWSKHGSGREIAEEIAGEVKKLPWVQKTVIQTADGFGEQNVSVLQVISKPMKGVHKDFFVAVRSKDLAVGMGVYVHGARLRAPLSTAMGVSTPEMIHVEGIKKRLNDPKGIIQWIKMMVGKHFSPDADQMPEDVAARRAQRIIEEGDEAEAEKDAIARKQAAEEAEKECRRLRRQADDEEKECRRLRCQAEDEEGKGRRLRRQADDAKEKIEGLRRQAEEETPKPGRKQEAEEAETEVKRLRRQAEESEEEGRRLRRQEEEKEAEVDRSRKQADEEEEEWRRQDSEDPRQDARKQDDDPVDIGLATRRMRRQAEELEDDAKRLRRQAEGEPEADDKEKEAVRLRRQADEVEQDPEASRKQDDDELEEAKEKPITFHGEGGKFDVTFDAGFEAAFVKDNENKRSLRITGSAFRIAKAFGKVRDLLKKGTSSLKGVLEIFHGQELQANAARLREGCEVLWTDHAAYSLCEHRPADDVIEEALFGELKLEDFFVPTHLKERIRTAERAIDEGWGFVDEKVMVKVTNPGILEVPKGTKVWDLPESHFRSLIEKKGQKAIMLALLNLERWNKGRDGLTHIANWAREMIDKVKLGGANAAPAK